MEFEWLNDSRTPNKRDEITPPRSPRLPAPTKVTRICGNLTTSHWPGRHNPRIPDDTIALVRELARLMPDRQIARLLNRTGVETGHGNVWTQERVRGFRNHHDIAVFRDGEWAERGEITLEAAAKLIGVWRL